MKFTVRFEGGAELAKALNQLPPKVSRRVLLEVLKDVAEPMRAAMAMKAPREPGAPDLADNMAVSVANRIGSVGGGKWQAAGETQAAVAVGPAKGFFYGIYQEFGTVRHGAQPFARPAFDSHAPKALTEIGRRLWVELAAKGISRTAGSLSGAIDEGESS